MSGGEKNKKRGASCAPGVIVFVSYDTPAKRPFRSQPFLLELSAHPSLTPLCLPVGHRPPAPPSRPSPGQHVLRARNVRFPWKPEASAPRSEHESVPLVPWEPLHGPKNHSVSCHKETCASCPHPSLPLQLVAAPGPPRWLGTARTLTLHRAHGLTCGTR